MCAHMHVEAREEWWVSSLTTCQCFCETGSLTEHEILLAPSLHLPSTGDYKQTPPHLAFYIAAGYSNSGSHACTRSTLPAETSPHLIVTHFPEILG